MCRWLHVLLVLAYVFVTIVFIIVLLVVCRISLAPWVRWLLLAGWFAVCFGGVILIESLGLLTGQGCRRPVRSEEDRLSALMDDVQERIRSKENAFLKMDATYGGTEMRFFIRTDPKRGDGSFGRRTIIISSGTLMMASDEELRGILAHEMGHLRDGD